MSIQFIWKSFYKRKLFDRILFFPIKIFSSFSSQSGSLRFLSFTIMMMTEAYDASEKGFLSFDSSDEENSVGWVVVEAKKKYERCL